MRYLHFNSVSHINYVKDFTEIPKTFEYAYHYNLMDAVPGIGWGGQTMENLATVGCKLELDQIQANSIQHDPSGWPNDTRRLDLGASWLELGACEQTSLVNQH